jgi:ATP-dependent helicase Lhr and Lhr-like helicase
MALKKTVGYRVISDWLAQTQRKPFAFQQETWEAIHRAESGLVNAPTGCGKTYSVFLGAVIRFINQYPDTYTTRTNNGLQLLWITPLRALAKDIARAMEEALTALGLPWRVANRNGDTPTAERQQQKRRIPEILLITPESLHLLLAQKEYPRFFSTVEVIAIDEWHELIGSKRGVQVELALSRIVHLLRKTYQRTVRVWGISATIGNLEEAKAVLLAPLRTSGAIIRAKLNKKIAIKAIFPDEIERYPWAGHLGIKLADKVLPVINQYTTTLMFINTRGMSETWYQTLLQTAPDLAGAIALHHGSIDQELRLWVEDALHTERLKVVVCTASLDLGVDFRPVQNVIQVGSPKGVSRFLQRAGRSGHQPDAVSNIYFLPTHTLELVEVAALKAAIAEGKIEDRTPRLLCYDVLLQYLCTIAIGEGFVPEDIYPEVKSTYCFSELTPEEWQQLLSFLVSGGNALQEYDDFRKVEVVNGRYKVPGRRIAMRHRMHIGTIVSDTMLKVRFMSGGYVGVIEEYFISRLQPGDVFTLAGRNLEFVMIKEMTAIVRKSSAKKAIVPSWNGGRMPLSANLGAYLRRQLDIATTSKEPELVALQPLFQLQQQLSHLPAANELLIEHIETKDGFHLFVYPFEGRLVHEALAALLAYRLSRITPITFSIAMNDYGFELLSDQPIPVDDTNVYELFSEDQLYDDITRSVNSTEMARRKFRDIAVIGGLVFQGYPGERKKPRHLQASASLLFNVFSEYDTHNLLLRQAYNEVMEQQMEEARLRNMLQRIGKGKIVITFPQQLTPFCFPIKVDSMMREQLSSERLEDRVKKMIGQLK